ncbi:MAG: hypothetical protein HY849_10020 [Nitrosomonadales bacterium]|nr:hypothetical protein [Nitrosomonadales bacterium]
MSEQLSNEAITEQATASVSSEGDIRSRVRSLTLSAIKQRHLEATEVREIIKALVSGINLGLEKRGADSKQAVGEAFAGLDEALQKSAEATHLALQELTDHGREFSNAELADALENLKRTEKEFLATVGEVANLAGERVKAEWQELLTHATRAGTDTGRQVSDTVGVFSRRLGDVAGEVKAVGGGAVRQLSSRVLQVASGMLAGLIDALHEKK